MARRRNGNLFVASTRALVGGGGQSTPEIWQRLSGLGPPWWRVLTVPVAVLAIAPFWAAIGMALVMIWMFLIVFYCAAIMLWLLARGPSRWGDKWLDRRGIERPWWW